MKKKHKTSDLIAKTAFGAICVITCTTCGVFLFTQSDFFPTSAPPAFGWDDMPVDSEAGIDFNPEKGPLEARPKLESSDQNLIYSDSEAETTTAAELIAEKIPEQTNVGFIASDFDNAETETPVDLFPKIQVSSIFYDLARPSAKINGQILHAGDSVSGAQVIEISQENIVIQHAGERRSFTLK